MRALLAVGLMTLTGCWLMPPASYTLNRGGVEVVDQANIGKQNIQLAVDKVLTLTGHHPSKLAGLQIHAVNVPICVEGPDPTTFIVADGITMNKMGQKVILASTVQGCFHAVAHEVAHVLVGDENHDDEEFWNKIEEIEKEIQETHCADTYKEMTPEEAAKAC